MSDMPSFSDEEYRGVRSAALGRIGEIFTFLRDFEFLEVMTGLNSDQRRKYQDRLLGRDVWDQFYQTIQGEDGVFLKSKGYTKILVPHH